MKKLTREVLELRRNGWTMPRIARRFGVSTSAVSIYISKRVPHLSRRQTSPTGLCAICCQVKQLVADHCHVSGAEREMLCGACNAAIGLMADDPHRLRRAAAYVEKHRDGVCAPQQVVVGDIPAIDPSESLRIVVGSDSPRYVN